LVSANDCSGTFSESDPWQAFFLRVSAKSDPIAIYKKSPRFSAWQADWLRSVLHLEETALRAFRWTGNRAGGEQVPGPQVTPVAGVVS
jgi:hypothetical protein